jgi:plastocyanin
MLNARVRICALIVYSPFTRDTVLYQPQGAKTQLIVIDKFTFQPNVVTVPAGETVEWKNRDIVPHTATSLDGATFNSGQIQTGGSWRVTLRKRGSYGYLCTLHPNMKATLIVR